jgi:integration host factor subunit beta
VADALVLSELIHRMQFKNRDLPSKVVEAAVRRVFAEITDALAAGRRVELRGFGSFDVREHDSRGARNPRTGETIELRERRSVHWRMSKVLGNQLSGQPTG